MASLIDHVFLTVTNVERSVAFYTKVLAPMGITGVLNWKAKDGPANHPDLHGFGRDKRYFFWVKAGRVESPSHIGFACKNKDEVNACYAAAISAGGVPDESYGGAPSARTHYSPEYYAGSVLDLDGHELEFTYKEFQHPSPGTD